ncbi:MAG: DUF3576 domain-containing protein [Tateyamaria sp.]|nr:DUF3576 domain-containing protein [Tateyamaria sp.]
MRKTILTIMFLSTVLSVGACGRSGVDGPDRTPTGPDTSETGIDIAQRGESIWTLFSPPEVENTVRVNKYIWAASLQVLEFLPVQTVDPFTGVIVTGFGTPPNGSRAYRATILINDPALDARSLNVALQTRSGAASPSTVRAIEDAILTRARQMRIGDNKY